MKKARRRARREDQQPRPETCGKARTQFKQGNYRASDETVTLELEDGKCNLTFGPERIACGYKLDGDKVTLSPTMGDKSQTIVLTAKDGEGTSGRPDCQTGEN
jgi:hypothetical protein